MEAVTKLAWFALAAIHAAPAAVLFAPSLARRLYGVSPTDDLGVLIVHRGALFLGIVMLAVWAALDPNVRRAAGAVVAISVVGFLAVYLRSGAPDGALRPIAIADAIALMPLAWTLWHAWTVRSH